MKLRVLLFFVLGVFVMTGQINAAPDDILWIDVRTPDEHSARNIAGHINIPHDAIEARISELNLAPDQVIKLYCRTGRRSGMAQQTLEMLGFSHSENIGSFESALAVVSGEEDDEH